MKYFGKSDVGRSIGTDKSDVTVKVYTCKNGKEQVTFTFYGEAKKAAAAFHDTSFASDANGRLYFMIGNGIYNISNRDRTGWTIQVSNQKSVQILKTYEGSHKIRFDEMKGAYYIERKKDGISKPVKGDEKSIPANPDPLPEIAQVIKGVLNEIIEERKDEFYSLIKNAIRDGFEEVGK